ncbi:MAG: DUF1559 domain-containing protein, partial [Verrucomicrobiae bacterium]|nr:DUF1559 domain-containing protein [Verrucomicrobiae bacterium]
MTKPPSRTCPRTGSEFGFTVIELLVAFSIITVLIALLVLGMEPMRERARRVVCMNNIRQIGLAMLTYADDHDEHPFTAVDPSAGTQVTFNTGIGSHWYELRNYLKHPGILYCPSALK